MQIVNITSYDRYNWVSGNRTIVHEAGCDGIMHSTTSWSTKLLAVSTIPAGIINYSSDIELYFLSASQSTTKCFDHAVAAIGWCVVQAPANATYTVTIGDGARGWTAYTEGSYETPGNYSAYNYSSLASAIAVFNPPATATNGYFVAQLSGAGDYTYWTFDMPGRYVISARDDTSGEDAIYNFDIVDVHGQITNETSNTDDWRVQLSAQQWPMSSWNTDWTNPSWNTSVDGMFTTPVCSLRWMVSRDGLSAAEINSIFYTRGAGLTRDGDYYYTPWLTSPDYEMPATFYFNTPFTKTFAVELSSPGGSATTCILCSGIGYPSISSTSFYSSSIDINLIYFDYSEGVGVFKGVGTYGTTYRSNPKIFDMDDAKSITWNVCSNDDAELTNLILKDNTGTIIIPPIVGTAATYSILSAISLNQNTYTFKLNYTDMPQMSAEYTWDATTEPLTLDISGSDITECALNVITAVAIIPTLPDETIVNLPVAGEWLIRWYVTGLTTDYTVYDKNNNVYVPGELKSANTIGSIKIHIDDESTSPVERTLFLTVQYVRNGVVITDSSDVYKGGVGAPYIITYEQHPSDSIFNVDFNWGSKILASEQDAIWRESDGTPYAITLSAQISPNPSTWSEGDIFWDLGDGNTATTSVVNHNYNTATVRTSAVITLYARCVVPGNNLWSRALTKQQSLIVYFDQNYPHAELFVYPQGVWESRDYVWLDGETDYTIFTKTTIPPHEIGEGHTARYLLSTIPVVGMNYRYRLNDGQDIIDVTELTHSTTVGNSTYELSGLLNLYDNIFYPVDMPSASYDDNGNSIIYSNFSPFVIQVCSYDIPSLTVNTSSTITNANIIVNGISTFTFDASSPVSIDDASLRYERWVLSASDGTVQTQEGYGSTEPYKFTVDFLPAVTYDYTLQAFVTGRLIITKDTDLLGSPADWSYRTVTIESSATNIEIFTTNFTISANQDYSIYDTGAGAITGYPPLTATGVYTSDLPGSLSSTWLLTVDDQTNISITTPASSTIASWICSYNLTSYTSGWYTIENFENEITTDIVLQLSSTIDSTTYTFPGIPRQFIVKAPPTPHFQIFPTIPYGIVDQTITYINATVENVIPAVYVYIWNDETSTTEIYGLSSYTTSYSQAGTYDIYLSAIDLKGYLHTTVFPNIIQIFDSWPEYDSDIIRTANQSIALPLTQYQTRMPPNEWVTTDNVNAVFDKMFYLLDYLDTVATLHAPPPADYLGWFGRDSDDNSNKWHLQFLDTNMSVISSDQPGFISIKDFKIRSDNSIIIADQTTPDSAVVYLLDSGYKPSIIARFDGKSIDDNFVEVKSVVVDSNDHIIVLDSKKHEISVFEYDPDSLVDTTRLLYSFGTIGGPNSKIGFYQPNELSIDNNNYLWVTDTGNKVIKKFSATGSWIMTITHSILNDKVIVSTAVDDEDNIHVLTTDSVIKFNSAGEYLESYDWLVHVKNDIGALYRTNGGMPAAKKIVRSQDDGVMYICLTDQIIKISTDGNYIGTFGIPNYSDDINTNFNSILHHTDRSFYIVNKYNILKYVDFVQTLTVRVNNILPWSREEVYVKKEFIQDWVYNRSFHRMWDNIEAFRRSLYGDWELTEDEDGDMSLSIVSRTSSNWPELHYQKTDIYIGVNELVTSNVINRCLDQLYSNLATLLNMLKS